MSATKGIETDTLALMSEVFAECLPQAPVRRALGPELRDRGVPGPADRGRGGGQRRGHRARRAAALRHADVPGLLARRRRSASSWRGALKNVIAIAAGILEGLGLGHNPRAALITRGLAEITRLGVALGADPLTFAGLAGMGDLVLTTTGSLSRNRALGRRAGAGRRRSSEYRAAHRTRGRRRQHLARRRRARARAWAWSCRSSRRSAKSCSAGSRRARRVAELMARELKSEQWR